MRKWFLLNQKLISLHLARVFKPILKLRNFIAFILRISLRSDWSSKTNQIRSVISTKSTDCCKFTHNCKPCALNRVKPSAIPHHDCSYNLNWGKIIATKKLSNSIDLHTKFTQNFSFSLSHLAHKLHACIHIQPTMQIALDCVTPRQSEVSKRANPQLTLQVNWTPPPPPRCDNCFSAILKSNPTLWTPIT